MRWQRMVRIGGTFVLGAIALPLAVATELVLFPCEGFFCLDDWELRLAWMFVVGPMLFGLGAGLLAPRGSGTAGYLAMVAGLAVALGGWAIWIADWRFASSSAVYLTWGAVYVSLSIPFGIVWLARSKRSGAPA